MICVISSQEVIFKLNLHHCFFWAVMCPFTCSFFPPTSPDSALSHSKIKEGKRILGGVTLIKGTWDLCGVFWKTNTQELGGTAHWSCSLASLSSLRQCPQPTRRISNPFYPFGFYLTYNIHVTYRPWLLLNNCWPTAWMAGTSLSWGLYLIFCISLALVNSSSSLLLLPFAMALPAFAFSLLTHFQSKYNPGE